MSHILSIKKKSVNFVFLCIILFSLIFYNGNNSVNNYSFKEKSPLINQKLNKQEEIIFITDSNDYELNYHRLPNCPASFLRFGKHLLFRVLDPENYMFKNSIKDYKVYFELKFTNAQIYSVNNNFSLNGITNSKYYFDEPINDGKFVFALSESPIDPAWQYGDEILIKNKNQSIEIFTNTHISDDIILIDLNISNTEIAYMSYNFKTDYYGVFPNINSICVGNSNSYSIYFPNESIYLNKISDVGIFPEVDLNVPPVQPVPNANPVISPQSVINIFVPSLALSALVQLPFLIKSKNKRVNVNLIKKFTKNRQKFYKNYEKNKIQDKILTSIEKNK